ncbi:glycoside hydrolase family 2 protein [Sphingobacterium anhuiense]|uniref:beta-galactosidase n=1 Tax=Sphingobacterium anhuiense TaxID=493780 RepID=A0ABW5YXF0_9SPHI
MQIVKNWSVIILMIFFASHLTAQNFMAGGRQHLPPKPTKVAGVAIPVKSLDGEWEINLNPTATSISDKTISANWQKIMVPGEAMMQGFKIKHDTAFVYRKKINITENTKGKRHAVRFNGVFNHAKVYFNGNLVREHFGGFTAWDADITKFIKPGQDNWLHVEVTDRADDISYASGYAHHTIGGITRKVDYVILPESPVQYLYAKSWLTNNYTDGTLSIQMELPQSKDLTAYYELIDPSGKKVWSKPRSLKATGNIWKDSIAVPKVSPWTAESPFLYKMILSVIKNGKTQQTIEQLVGFRSIEINKDNEMLVNGKTVKLRGACRHDMHPTLGRSTNRAQDSVDAVLTKESNMNFIRTSHYPPTEDFLEFCDRYGIYVQEETAVCFVLDWRVAPYNKFETQSNSSYTDRYLGQLSEMIDRDRNHASIVMWSIGNESNWGTNFQKSYEFVKSVDKSRPVSWSFPATALDQGKRNFDILVSHYPAYNGKYSDLGKYEKNMKGDLPIIGDEWVHVNCYNTDLSTYDPNVRDFWGVSMDSTWTYRFDVKGYLGGAIWGMIDETFTMKDGMTGYGPWGIVDVWRRKKTEFWNTKKAYSPIRVLLGDVKKATGSIILPLHNRYDHTNLQSIKATALINGKEVAIVMPDVAPHAKGEMIIPVSTPTSSVKVQFKDKTGALIDEELINMEGEHKARAIVSTGVWKVADETDQLTLKSGDFTFKINKKTGAIDQGSVKDVAVITGNPLLVVNRPKDAGVLKNTDAILSGDYRVANFSFDQLSKEVFVIHSKGEVDKYPVEMVTSLYPNGQIKITYSADSIPAYTWDIGVGVPVASDLDKISWDRKGYWTTYPEGHMSALKGTAKKVYNSTESFGVKPNFEVSHSMSDYFLTKKDPAVLYKAEMSASGIYRAKKENIYSYTVSGDQGALNVVSDGKQAAKMNVNKDGSQQLLVSDKWDYWTISWGNYQGTRNKTKKSSGTVFLQLK